MEENRELRKESDKKAKKRFRMTGTTLKIIANVFLLLYGISRIVIQNGMMHISEYTSSDALTQAISDDSHLAQLSGYASVLQLIGYLAIPMFAFLLTEGFLHTANLKKYMLTMAAAAVISEVPYDWAVNGKLLDFSSQNILFASLIALIALYGLSQMEKMNGIAPKLAQLMIIAAAVLWGVMAKVSFGTGTVLLASAYYLFRRKNLVRLMMGVAISMIYYTAPVAGLLLWGYNGERGKGNKYLFYAIYPIELLILGAIAAAV